MYVYQTSQLYPVNGGCCYSVDEGGDQEFPGVCCRDDRRVGDAGICGAVDDEEEGGEGGRGVF